MWPENWPAFLMFCRLLTQWRTGQYGPGGLIGLDYNVMRWLFELYQVEDQRAMFEDLRIMEDAYLVELMS